MSLRKIYISIVYMLQILILISSINSICLDRPSYIKVSTGSMDLGEFPYSSLNSNNIYIQSDIDTYPLKIELYFEDIELDCFIDSEDVKIKLFSNSLPLAADSISTSSNLTIAKFIFDLPTIAPDSFSSDYTIKNKNNAAGTTNSINFATDNINPQFTTFSINPSSSLIAEETQITIDYTITDTKSGLKSLLVIGKSSQAIDFDKNSSYSSQITDTLTSSQTYTLTATDMLGNQASENITFNVDNSAPSISNFKRDNYYITSNSRRAISFSLITQDDSFSQVTNIPIVTGDFSKINSQESNRVANCIKSITNDEQYICEFDIEITELTQTTTVSITITSQDSLGHQTNQTFTEEIFYDTSGPVITDFYLENSQGQRNIFNSQDNSSKVILKFSDESLDIMSDISLRSDFEGLDFLLTSNCNITTNNQVTCFWNLGETLRKYSAIQSGNLTFFIEVTDKYSNSETAQANIKFDNIKPKITGIELIETDNIKDGIVQSGEKIEYKLYITEKNIVLDNDFIFADFSQIDYRDGMEKIPANCGAYNETTSECKFKNIIVENGYMNKTVTFYVIDAAANVNIETKEIEILQIGDEVPRSFEIPDITITNILNRHIIVATGSTAWFEGLIETITDNEDMKIINYYLKSCNDSGLNPVLLGDRNLYPDDTVERQQGDNEAKKKFILKVDVRTHPNIEDLNEKTMGCTMSILKIDSDTIYNPELVNFNIKFLYYELPHDTLLKANAANILDMAESADFIGDWFDGIYDIYKMMDNACTVINTVINGVSAVATIVSGVQAATAWIDWVEGGAVTGSLQAAITGVQSSLAGIRDYTPIKYMCDFVQCKLPINNWWKEIPGMDMATSGGALGKMMGSACTATPKENSSTTKVEN